MNRKHQNRLPLLAGLTAVVIMLAACGGAAVKESGSKAGLFAAGEAKAGLSEAVMAGVLATALAASDGVKSVASITPGQTVAGLLSSEDDQLDDGSHFDAWLFELSGPAEVEIGMRSTEIDPYISLYQGHPGGYGTHVGSDDDSGGMPNALLRASLSAGPYTIMANSFEGGETGAYELSFVIAGGGSGGPGPTTLVAGRSNSGELTTSDPTLPDDSYFDAWTYHGTAGESITVTMTSSELDSYLLVFRGSLEDGEWMAEDDDSGGGVDASVTLTLPTAGVYTVAANTFGAGQTGSYQISVEEAASTDEVSFNTGGSPNEKYALLVGIDDYPGSGSDLRGPVRDAGIMQEVLTQRFGFDPANVVTLTDSEATRENIANGIVQHLGQAGPDGVAVFFYSGHGTQIGANIGLTGSLDPEPRGDGDEAIYIYGYSQESSVLLDEELGFLIETIDAGRALVVVDACFSGEITRGPGDAPQSKVVAMDDPEVAGSLRLPTTFIGAELKAAGELEDMSLGFGDLADVARVFQSPQRHVMWGASTEDQVSWTSGLGGGSSVFTFYVGEHMRSASLDTSLQDLGRAVARDVESYIREDGNMTMQNPRMRGSNASMTLGQFFGMR
ncbi:MAG: caspase family protein [Gemmatimonadetes bacterium]|nr:caspase family protein [Gemmatimonadota bacterium]